MDIHLSVITVMNRIIALTMSRDKPIQANAIAEVLIHFLPVDAFFSSDHAVSTKKPQ
jgi:hypothetical protein